VRVEMVVVAGIAGRICKGALWKMFQRAATRNAWRDRARKATVSTAKAASTSMRSTEIITAGVARNNRPQVGCRPLPRAHVESQYVPSRMELRLQRRNRSE
jgi:hypothetical protein